MKLNKKARMAIAPNNFALPGRRFPIEDKSHGRAALSMAHNASPEEQAEIRTKVKARYPGIKVKDEKEK